MALVFDFEIDYINVNITFLNFILKKEIYIQIPQFFKKLFFEFIKVKDVYIKLNKALYGLKQILQK